MAEVLILSTILLFIAFIITCFPEIDADIKFDIILVTYVIIVLIISLKYYAYFNTLDASMHRII